MNFNKEILEAIEKAGSQGKLSEESFLHYFNKYSVIKKSISIKTLLQGNFYTFDYNSFPKTERDYVNRRPVIFYDSIDVTVNKTLIRGIDLILLKPIDRKNFFIRLFAIYSKVMAQNESKPLSSQMPLKFDRELLETLMAGINYKHAYKAYNIEKIRGIIDIPQIEWKYLVYLDTRSILGSTLDDIYNKQ